MRIDAPPSGRKPRPASKGCDSMMHRTAVSTGERARAEACPDLCSPSCARPLACRGPCRRGVLRPRCDPTPQQRARDPGQDRRRASLAFHAHGAPADRAAPGRLGTINGLREHGIAACRTHGGPPSPRRGARGAKDASSGSSPRRPLSIGGGYLMCDRNRMCSHGLDSSRSRRLQRCRGNDSVNRPDQTHGRYGDVGTVACRSECGTVAS